MVWWAWILFGLGLLAAEMLTPGGFFVLFFGLAALLVGALVAIGAGGPDWFQWLLFSLLSVASMLVFRRRLVDRFNRPALEGRKLDSLVGEVAVLTGDLAPGGTGKAELRGTSWTVRTRGPAILAHGTRCTVESVEGLTLWVRPEREV
jgi:membrane protein implicated in regulation of membrane protease activity